MQIAMSASEEGNRLPVTSTPRSVDRHSNIVADSFQPDLSEVHGRVLDDPFPDIAMEDAQGDYTALGKLRTPLYDLNASISGCQKQSAAVSYSPSSSIFN